MTTHQFHVGRLTCDDQVGTWLALHIASTDNELRVRLTVADAQELAITLAGVASAPVRFARLSSQIAQFFDASLSHVQLSRGAGHMIEAALVLAKAGECYCLPVTFGDGMALAVTHHLPIYGDESLTPLLKMTATADVSLPAAIASFLNTLTAE